MLLKNWEKIIVRENLLGELNRLLVNQYDVHSAIPEVEGLIKALRFQTVEIIEDIEKWHKVQVEYRPFLFRGQNYLVKISNDLSFMDSYPVLNIYFGIKFSSNPLAFQLPEKDNMVQKHTSSQKQLQESASSTSFYSKYGPNQEFNSYALSDYDLIKKTQFADPENGIDGIEFAKLRECEEVLFRELKTVQAGAQKDDRMKEKGVANRVREYNQIGGVDTESSLISFHPKTPSTNQINSANKNTYEKSIKKSHNVLQTKKERITVLKDELGNIHPEMSLPIILNNYSFN